MLILNRSEGENIDRLLKRYKQKYRRTKIREELRRRKEFTKPSVTRRKEILKAAYKAAKQTDE